MAKPTTVKIKLAEHGRHGLLLRHEEESAHQDREAVSFSKYDPVVRKHVEFKEAKIK